MTCLNCVTYDVIYGILLLSDESSGAERCHGVCIGNSVTCSSIWQCNTAGDILELFKMPRPSLRSFFLFCMDVKSNSGPSPVTILDDNKRLVLFNSLRR